MRARLGVLAGTVLPHKPGPDCSAPEPRALSLLLPPAAQVGGAAAGRTVDAVAERCLHVVERYQEIRRQKQAQAAAAAAAQ